MRKLPSRQVHLDFHTSPHIPGVGAQVDKAQFQAALKEGNLNSITVFAKCHHGYCYYPTKVGAVHPTLDPDFDLTGAMIDAAHEIGVAAPIYITGGWSVHDSEAHPEWCMRKADGTMHARNYNFDAQPDDPRPPCCWLDLCLSGEYAEHIYALTQEIVDRYPVIDGLFFDIVYLHDACYCPNCLKGMKEEGLDPDNEADAKEYYRRSHLRFMAECDRILHEKHPEATIFFNSGGAEIYRPEYHPGQTHYEMEDLPTAWGGYDKFPPRASFMSRYADKEYLGMTGKFHTEWGEFGGYKNPDALKYEVLLMAMYNAKCSIGDQMPPSGWMDMETYRIIGHAYRALEEIEPWCYPAKSTAALGVYLSGNAASDEGLHQMLLEGHIDFEIVHPGDSLAPFRALVLPDCVNLSCEEAARINAFASNGGAVLFGGTSAIADDKFLLDAGVKYAGPANYRQDYLCVGDTLKLPYGNAPFLCYESSVRTEITDGEALAQVYEPWFDRTYARFCSHRNTPYRPEPAAHPAIVRKGSVVYIAHPLCRLYKEYGAQLFREVFLKALSLIYTPAYSVSLPSGGRTRLTFQPEHSRYVFHAAYATPVQRGRTSILEDMPAIANVHVGISMTEAVKKVALVPSGDELSFAQENGILHFTIPEVQCHQAVEIII